METLRDETWEDIQILNAFFGEDECRKCGGSGAHPGTGLNEPDQACDECEGNGTAFYTEGRYRLAESAFFAWENIRNRLTMCDSCRLECTVCGEQCGPGHNHGEGE